MQRFARFLKAARKRQNKTLQRVANEAGLDYWAYASMELGRRKRLPDPETIDRLAESLGVTVSDLVESAGYKCGAGHADA